MGMMKEKPNIIRKTIIIWIILVIILSIFVIYAIHIELEYQKELRDNGEMDSELKLYRETMLIKNTLFRLIPVVLSFLFVIGTYMVKKWAWLGGLMLSFYLLLVYFLGVADDIQNAVIVGFTEYPFFDLYGSLFSPIVIVLAVVIVYLHLKTNVKTYFNISY